MVKIESMLAIISHPHKCHATSAFPFLFKLASGIQCGPPQRPTVLLVPQICHAGLGLGLTLSW